MRKSGKETSGANSLTRRASLIAALGATASCAGPSGLTPPSMQPDGRKAGPPYANLYRMDGDIGQRGGPAYIARRAFVQITRDLSKTEVPPTQALDIQAMAARPFAVSWLGHSALLLRAGERWLMLDPFLSGTAGPIPGFGPARLTPLPLPPDRLPQIDFVLISHNHYDHLDLASVRSLSGQTGGPPRFLVGLGLSAWFVDALGVRAEEHDWWQETTVGDLKLTFVPAQHNSGRNRPGLNDTLWGGWVVERRGRRFYYAGDTAYVEDLFRLIRQRIGAPDLAAIPIGAYTPPELMRYEHVNPAEAVKAHLALGAARSLAVHWGTLQLGDEEPFTPARDLAAALEAGTATGFGVAPVGAIVNIGGAHSFSRNDLVHPSNLRPALAG